MCHTPFRTRSSAARPTGPQCGFPPGRPRSPFCPMSIRNKLFMAADPRARRIAASSASAKLPKNRAAISAGSRTQAAARSPAGSPANRSPKSTSPRAFRPRRRRSRDGGRRAPTPAGPPIHRRRRHRPRPPGRRQRGRQGRRLGRRLRSRLCSPWMGAAVGSDRRLGGWGNVQRPEEGRRRIGRMGAAADRRVVERLAGNPRHHGPVLGETLGRFTESHRGRHRGRHRQRQARVATADPSAAGPGWRPCAAYVRPARPRDATSGCPSPPATSRMVRPARSGCCSRSRSRTRSAVISSSVPVIRGHCTEAACSVSVSRTGGQ